ncbi:hypothetical protein NB694_001034 [Pantoea ananatis]|nr:hypothetical protein [Pantoea ananatis]
MSLFGRECNIRDGGGRRMIRRVAPHPAGRADARCLALLDSNLDRRFSSLSPKYYDGLVLFGQKGRIFMMVVGEGFEPSKSVTADLQSAPFGRSGIPPGIICVFRQQVQMVVGEGFEPSKSVTADLQSAPFGRSGIPPGTELLCSEAGRIIPNAP